jgi:hypothetical protein
MRPTLCIALMLTATFAPAIAQERPIDGSYPKSVIEDEAFLVQRLASKVAGLNPRFI